MKILSLFDGMACGMVAMLECGVEIKRYVAYEIDEYAVKTSSHNFPIIEHRGDVFGADFSEFRGFDFLVGGSPCTYWSIAQTKNRETVASGMGWELFCQYKRALDEAQPRYFIYENNKSMSAAIRQSITEAFGFEPVCINSALVSAQNRQRLYWVGRREADGTYSRVHVDQPEDRGILLRDVLDGAWGVGDSGGKSYGVTATYGKHPQLENTLTRHQRTMVAEPVNMTTDGKAQCIRATCYKDGIRKLVGNDVDRKTAVAEPVAVNMQPMGRRRNEDGDFSYQWEARTDGKASTITQANTRRTIAEPVEFDGDVPTFARSGADGKVYPVYRVKDGIITIKDKQYPIKLADGYWTIRKLTVSECKRLQTVPEWYEFPVSNTQAYKMLGNGWTVQVTAHLIRAVMEGERMLYGND